MSCFIFLSLVWKIPGESSLTVDALAKHDEQQIDQDGDVGFRAESDVVSAAGKTFNTWATNWTECTNTTFNRVHRYWASNSAFHKEVNMLIHIKGKTR
jgi:ribosomal RNA-processing protein 12